MRTAKSSEVMTFSFLRIKKGLPLEQPCHALFMPETYRPFHAVGWQTGAMRWRGNALGWDSEVMGSHLSSTTGFVTFVLTT